jgi:hypothetical protein
MYHEAWINSSTNISAKGVPTFRVEEVPKLSKIMVDQKFSGSIIKPRIEFVDD